MNKIFNIIFGLLVTFCSLSFFIPEERGLALTAVVVNAEDALPAYPCKAQAVTGVVKIKKMNGSKVRLTIGTTINSASSIIFARTSNKVLMIDSNQKTWWVLPRAYATNPAVACNNNCTPVVQPNVVNDTSSVILPVMFFHQ